MSGMPLVQALLLLASLVAVIAYCVKRSVLRNALGGSEVRWRKSSATAAHNPFPDTRERSGIGVMARFPSSRFFQNNAVVLPIGETIPAPVTATCSIAT